MYHHCSDVSAAIFLIKVHCLKHGCRMDLLLCYKREIATLVREGCTYFEVSSLLISRHPGVRGLSERSIRRFCSKNGIRYRSGLTDARLDR